MPQASTTIAEELKLVVQGTEEAATAILQATDAIGTIAASLPAAQSEALQAEITRIYEACSFQDLSGQRIKNVLGLLANRSLSTSEPSAKTGDASLLNGPQTADKALSQAEIDRMLSGE